MQTRILVVVSALAMVLSSVATAAEYKAGEVIVKYKDGTFRTRLMMNDIYNSVGAVGVKRLKGVMKGYEQITLQQNVSVEEAIRALQQNPAVEYAQPNYILRIQPVIEQKEIAKISPMVPCIIPGIPYPPGCEDSGDSPFPPGDGGGQPTPPSQRPEVQPAPADVDPPVADPSLSKAYGLAKVGATDAWKSNRGSKEIIVADIDTGVDYNHEDLSFNMWRNPNPKNNDVVGYNFVHNDGLPYDDNQHGTHTSGTIGAVGGNGKGVSGVSQRVSIMALKFLSGEGSGTTADAIRAIDYAVEHGAKVMSNSWGGKGDDGNNALLDSVKRAEAKGVLFIAAAGNDGTDNDGRDPAYPAAFKVENMISVAATDEKDRMAFFSNYGKTTTHVGAPGANVYSTVPGNKYASLSGTSMACPHVAGAAALVWSAHPEWNYKQVKKALMDSVDKLTALEGKTVTGGRINVQKAIRMTGVAAR